MFKQKGCTRVALRGIKNYFEWQSVEKSEEIRGEDGAGKRTRTSDLLLTKKKGQIWPLFFLSQHFKSRI